MLEVSQPSSRSKALGQLARQNIDKQLTACGCTVQDMSVLKAVVEERLVDPSALPSTYNQFESIEELSSEE